MRRRLTRTLSPEGQPIVKFLRSVSTSSWAIIAEGLVTKRLQDAVVSLQYVYISSMPTVLWAESGRAGSEGLLALVGSHCDVAGPRPRLP